jgi:phospholipid/cholesterol/gamma-HCH transport system ATP-binding protein
MSIRFEALTKSFGDRVILKDLSFEVKKGEILFILGKSGMGKSVTLKHIIGLLKPDSGRVFVDDDCVSDAGPRELPKIRQKCGMVFQHPALLDSLSVFQNIAFGLRTPQYLSVKALDHPLEETELRERVVEKLALVHLPASILDKMPSEISYGMQKRVSLARTLAPDPSYLLFDEPTTGLDPIVTNAINRLIQELSRKLQVTSVVVSHDMHCALAIADRILVLDRGEVLALETVENIKQSREPVIRAFLEEALSV